jgi:AhpC/TSA antioxidant enzyme
VQVRDRWSDFEALGAAALVLSFDKPDAVDDYQKFLGLPYPIASDPQRKAYAAYGVGRGPAWRIWSPRVIWQYISLVARGRKLQKPRQNEDLSQLGGDFILAPQGHLLYTHVSKSPSDRPPVHELLKAMGT